MEVYCNNCGIKGHIYRDCKFPIISCGILLYRNDNNIPKILMVQRKDSLCYIDFLRGKYDIYNISYVQILIDKCTNDEKNNLINYSFDYLWKKLWLIDQDIDIKKNDKNVIDYKRGLDKFNKLSNGFFYKKTKKFINLEYFIDKSKLSYKMSEWEIPKGRRNNRETDFDCAIREFEEETNYNKDDYKLIKNMIPFNEEFVGENGVRYKYIYYIGYLLNLNKEVYIDFNNKNQYTELKNIKWLTRMESLDKLRNYHHSRYYIINKIFNLIDELNNDKYSLVN